MKFSVSGPRADSTDVFDMNACSVDNTMTLAPWQPSVDTADDQHTPFCWLRLTTNYCKHMAQLLATQTLCSLDVFCCQKTKIMTLFNNFIYSVSVFKGHSREYRYVRLCRCSDVEPAEDARCT